MADYFQSRQGVLHAEDVSLVDLASEFGTPTYVYSRAAITEAYNSYQQAFRGTDHQICYAVKANSNLGVLSLLASLGAGFDIVSGGELQRVQRAGGRADKVVFSGVGKTREEINFALGSGIQCFNVESRSELLLIEQCARGFSTPAPISIRVNPDVDAMTHPYISTGLKDNKFGVSVAEAMSLYAYADQSKDLVVRGVDCHIGSQILDLAPFQDAFVRVLDLVDDLHKQGIELQHIDLGGGIGVRYRDETVIPMETFGAAIQQQLGNRKHTLMFEPGRALVANAGVLLCRVVHLKENEGKHFAVVDAAMNDLLRPALYGAWQNIETVEESPGANEQSYDIVGPVCETGDFLGKERMLRLAPDSLVVVRSAGAYSFAMSSNYNSRNRAAEVMVDQNQAICIRERETLEDQLRLEHVFKT